jgi:hypothetical protein
MNKFKKFIWVGIAAVAIGGFAIFNVSLNSQNGLSTIHKANLEALSQEIATTRYNKITWPCFNNPKKMSTTCHVSYNGMYTTCVPVGCS